MHWRWTFAEAQGHSASAQDGADGLVAWDPPWSGRWDFQRPDDLPPRNSAVWRSRAEGREECTGAPTGRGMGTDVALGDLALTRSWNFSG